MRAVVLHRWRPWYWYLLHPWRYCPLRSWLIDHSRLYRRFLMWRFKRANLRMQKAIGKRLLPAIERTTEAMREWMEEAKRV